MQFPVDRLHAGTAHEAHRGSYGRRNDYVTIHVLILVPVFFVLMKERALRRGTLRTGGD
jgi:hypothetical protein